MLTPNRKTKRSSGVYAAFKSPLKVVGENEMSTDASDVRSSKIPKNLSSSDTSQFDALSKLDQNESLHRYSTGCYSRNNNSSFSTRKCSTSDGVGDNITLNSEQPFSSCIQS
uniref:Uncharacterized protein n=1 Tax=Trichobilharzia regenti TaxID=157069 RepID=A0AA85KI51_TRIRE|nr:unnamed protein product [Trichobilharzia regenti]